jgi:hypothetical protein
MQKIFSSMMAAIGTQLKQSVKSFHSFTENLLLPTIQTRYGRTDTQSVFTFIVEAVDAVDGGTLVVAAEEEKVLRVLDLVGKQQGNRLQGLLASVHVVPQEQVVGIRGEPAVLEEPQQIIVLPMDVA